MYLEMGYDFDDKQGNLCGWLLQVRSDNGHENLLKQVMPLAVLTDWDGDPDKRSLL
jgi:hypothetical protein